MWLLENKGNVFGGRRLWLRPGKLYLFGRTVSEPGQVVISHKTISRKHLTINVDDVRDGDGQNLSSRSKVTIEDLGTKSGTIINGQRIKEPYVVSGDAADVKMGHCPDLFLISWCPVVLSFNFTSKELQANPIAKLSYLEQLDIKFITDYRIGHTTHVVSKKRNTSKSLQALINGKYIVTDSFVDAIRAAAAPPADGDGSEPSVLEGNYDTYWPDAMEYVPPRGGEPVERSASAYSPDPDRQDIFDGYTFIFYDKVQFENLMGPITNGKGKALYHDVIPGSTNVDDFVRYVKSEAGEKGLGSFEDGSEGKGVVVVRFVPNKGDQIEWYSQFFNSVSLQLDHRPIEQNEFLEAVLSKTASILRRPLQLETQHPDLQSEPSRQTIATTVSSDMDQLQSVPSSSVPESNQALLQPTRRGRARGPARRRFAGFDDRDDADEPPAPAIPESNTSTSQDALFVSQDQPAGETPEETSSTRQSQRKRPASTEPEEGLMEGIAPTAAAVKRRRIEAGEDPVPLADTPQPTGSQRNAEEKAAKSKKVKKEIDILDEARKRREEMEARALAEKEDLAHLPADVDLTEIRRLNIEEDMEVRQVPAGRNEQDVEDGRWNPRWNGRKNFKRFRQRGTATGRPTPKVIVPLDEVKKKDFGIGDDYWLEDEDQRKKSRDTQSSSIREETSQLSARPLPARVVLDESEDEVPEDDGSPSEIPAPSQPEPPRTRGTRASQSQGTARSQPARQSAAKRSAPALTKEPPAKKQRTTRQTVLLRDSDDSDDDELQFKFGKRR